MARDIIQVHKELKWGERKWLGSRYYDYPDGEDLLGKLSFTTKLMFFPSAFFGIVHSNSPPVPPTVTGKLLRVAKFVVPAVGMAVAFTCVTYLATNLRKKDDQFNYVLGGIAAGLVLGPTVGFHFGVWAPLYCAAFAAAKKTTQMDGTTFFGVGRPQKMTSYYMRNLDTTLMAERAGNWTREPAK